ncbi:MAG: DNA primase small subunit domain-containing protein [Promethearchaeota archaeon]
MNFTQFYLQKLFQAYYKARVPHYSEISDFTKREFAFLRWDRPGMMRHIGYPSPEFLYKYLTTYAPRHSYRSATIYKNPSADKMEYKGYLGCDFVVDIDSDHIPTQCQHDHNYTVCKSCGHLVPGEKPEECLQCHGKKFKKVVWICDKCLNVSKEQVYNLVDGFLLKEFNIPIEQIKLNFSGHRGYHVHLEDAVFRAMDQEERREIVDFILGQGFSYNIWQYKPLQNNMNGFRLDQPGWPGKIAHEFYSILRQGSDAINKAFTSPRYGKPIRPNLVNVFVGQRMELLERLESQNSLWGIPHIGMPTWHRIFEILRDRIKADIDVVVSIDPHRLIRLEDSIHGKAGFRVMDVPYETLESFDPLNDALAFPQDTKNTLSVKITAPICPPIRIGKKTYDGFESQKEYTLPLNVGLFLLCKDVAELIKN